MPPGAAGPVTQRLLSLDALRGFDMFWIVGAEELVRGLKKVTTGGPVGLVAEQLRHKAWEGFHFEDLIFPLFVFIVGVSLVFSLTKALEQGGRRAALIRSLRRSVLLYALGILYYGGLSTPIEKIRLVGVLQRIALCYFFASLLFCYLKPKALAGVCAGLLLKHPAFDDKKKVAYLIAGGLGCLAVGWLWHLQFPVIKKVWTSSFVLVAGGYSCLLLAAFYQVIDAWKFQKWATPFVWIGVNPITIYFGGRFIDFEALAKLFGGGPVGKACGRYGELVLAVTTLAFGFWFLRFLYERKIFLRV